MALLSRALLFIGTILLGHACYSAHEHSSLSPSPSTSTPVLPASLAAGTLSSLPLDISIETLVSVLLICYALVLGAEELQPVSWRVWAGQVEQGTAPQGQGAGYKALEHGMRKGFLDIRAQRKEFADWMRAQGSQEKSVKELID